MVNKTTITATQYATLGFSSKNEAERFIKNQNIKSNPRQTLPEFLNEIRRALDNQREIAQQAERERQRRVEQFTERVRLRRHAKRVEKMRQIRASKISHLVRHFRTNKVDILTAGLIRKKQIDITTSITIEQLEELCTKVFQSVSFLQFKIYIQGKSFYPGEEGRDYIQIITSPARLEELKNIALTKSSDRGAVLFSGFIQLQSVVSVPFGPHNRSRIGQGNDILDVAEYDHDLFYVPSSGSCFRKCVVHFYGDDFHAQYIEFALKAKVVGDQFPVCKIKAFNQDAGTNICLYNAETRKYLYGSSPEDRKVIALIDGHFCVLKRDFPEAVRLCAEKIVWTPKVLTEEMLRETKEVRCRRPDPESSTRSELHENTYIWDCETYRSPVDGHTSIPYAAAFAYLGKVSNLDLTYETQQDEDRINNAVERLKKAVVVTAGNDCITDMVAHLLDLYKAKRTIKDTTIFLYAHNASHFDNLILLSLPNIEFSKVLKTGRGIVRVTTKHVVGEHSADDKAGKPIFLTIQWCDTASFLTGSLATICISNKIPPQIAKQSLNHQTITHDNWNEPQIRDSWYPYLQLDVISLAICFERYAKVNHEILNYHVNECVSNSSMAFSAMLLDINEHTESARELTAEWFAEQERIKSEAAEPPAVRRRGAGRWKKPFTPKPEQPPVFTNIHSFTNIIVQNYERKSIYGGRVTANCQSFTMEGYDDFEKGVFTSVFVDAADGTANGDTLVSTILDKLNMTEMTCLNDLHLFLDAFNKKMKKELYLEDRDADGKVIHPYLKKPFKDVFFPEKFIKHLPKTAEVARKSTIQDEKILPTGEKELVYKSRLFACDGNALYPAAFYLGDAWPDALSARLFKVEEEKEFIEKLEAGTFHPRLAILTVDLFIPHDNFFIAIAYRHPEKGNILCTGSFTGEYNSVDLQECCKHNSARIVKIHQGIVYDKNQPTNPFAHFSKKMYDMRDDYKAVGNSCGEQSVKQAACSTYGKSIMKPITETYKIHSESVLKRNYDHRYKDIEQLNNQQFVCKVSQNLGKIKTMPTHQGSFLLAYSRKIINEVIAAIDGFKTKKVRYSDTDSAYIPSEDYALAEKAGLIGSKFGQSKNDYGEGGIVFGRFIGNKIKYCLTVSPTGVIEYHKTFKGNENLTSLPFAKFEQMLQGRQVTEDVFRWKRSMKTGVMVFDKDDADADEFCMKKTFDPSITKRQKPDEKGWMAPFRLENGVLLQDD